MPEMRTLYIGEQSRIPIRQVMEQTDAAPLVMMRGTTPYLVFRADKFVQMKLPILQDLQKKLAKDMESLEVASGRNEATP